MKGHRLFAACYDLLTAPAERSLLGPIRARVVGGARGRVLALGAGTGADLPYLKAALAVAVEPDPYMLARAVARARSARARVALVQATGEHLPFRGASFDAVVVSLTLCTVDDLASTLAELRRVLRPGGELRFFEHVRAATAGWARFQRAVRPLWRRLAAGCSPDRDTLSAIRAAGFRVDDVVTVDAGMYPTRPFVYGVAQKED